MQQTCTASQWDPTSPLEVEEIYSYGAEMMMNQGLSRRQVQGGLVLRGLDPPTAERVAGELERLRSAACRSAGRKHILTGAAWCLGGLLLTAASWFAADRTAGVFLVAWGAILFGGLKGVYGSLRLLIGH